MSRAWQCEQFWLMQSAVELCGEIRLLQPSDSPQSMPLRSTSAALTAKLKGEQVSHVLSTSQHQLSVHFQSGIALVIEDRQGALSATIIQPHAAPGDGQRPTKRQNDYLTFIANYTARYRRAPAEADMARHFMVAAPSVNAMMQALERKGFITRKPGVARSVALSVDLFPARQTDQL